MFALSGLLTLVLLGVVGVELLRRTSTDEAIRDAKRVTSLAGHGIVEPALTDAALDGDPAARARFDRLVRRRILGGSVVRVKIWTRDGRIVYSDEPRLIGSRYSLGRDDLEAFTQGGVDAEVSDLNRPENRFERRYGKLLEVYLPIRTPSGKTVLFESYQRFSSVASGARHLWRAFAPALLLALVGLWLVQLPLALGLARRLRRGQQEREALLRRALEASDRERRRIAADLHDGVVQSLAGVSYTLAAEAETAGPESAETLREAANETRQGIRDLRSLLVEIYPPDLHRIGLSAALEDLAAAVRHRHVEAKIDVPPEVELPREVETLYFRVAQEALRNAVEHGSADCVDIRVRRENGRSSLVVADDGKGFDLRAATNGEHFGLRLIEDAARDAGGSAQIQSQPGGGTSVRVEVPIE
jgi:signal transduction histidine kinase